mgnify:CR=1 FL=1
MRAMRDTAPAWSRYYHGDSQRNSAGGERDPTETENFLRAIELALLGTMRSLAAIWLFARLCCSCLQLKDSRESSGVSSVKRRVQFRSSLLSRATQGAKRCRSESVESWHASTGELHAHFSERHSRPMQAPQESCWPPELGAHVAVRWQSLSWLDVLTTSSLSQLQR